MGVETVVSRVCARKKYRKRNTLSVSRNSIIISLASFFHFYSYAAFRSTRKLEFLVGNIIWNTPGMALSCNSRLLPPCGVVSYFFLDKLLIILHLRRVFEYFSVEHQLKITAFPSVFLCHLPHSKVCNCIVITKDNK